MLRVVAMVLWCIWCKAPTKGLLDIAASSIGPPPYKDGARPHTVSNSGALGVKVVLQKVLPSADSRTEPLQGRMSNVHPSPSSDNDKANSTRPAAVPKTLLVHASANRPFQELHQGATVLCWTDRDHQRKEWRCPCA